MEHASSQTDDMGDGITIKLVFYPQILKITTTVHLDHEVNTLLPLITERMPDASRIRLILEGRDLDLNQTFSQVHLAAESTIHVFTSSTPADDSSDSGEARHPARDAEADVETPRRGLERHLAAGVDRPSVVAMRLILLAQSGYLTEQQKGVFYMNPEHGTAPRGYQPPSLREVELLMEHSIPREGERAVYYPPQPMPEEHQTYPPDFISNQSFCLMMLEGGFPDYLRVRFSSLVPEHARPDEDTPLPVVPCRAFQLEECWVASERQGMTVTALGRERDLLGPGETINPRRRVTSNYVRFVTLLLGMLGGLLLHVVLLPYLFHNKLPSEVKLGIVVGMMANIIFSAFVAIADIL